MDHPTESENLEMQAATSSSSIADQQHTFVVENLEGKIRDTVKQSSMPSDESRTSLQNISNSLVPDPEVLESLEGYAKTISTNIDVMLRDLRESLSGKSLIGFYYVSDDLCNEKYSTRAVCFSTRIST